MKPISQIILDRKLDYIDLPQKFGKDRWLHFNINDPSFAIGLQPPIGVPTLPWIQGICSFTCGKGGLVSSAICLSNMMQWLVSELNIHRSNDLQLFPDFQLLYDVATSAPLTLWSAKGEYTKTLIQMLNALTSGCPFLKGFNGFDLDRDVISKGKSCVIEIPTVYPSWVRLFIVDLFIFQILYSRIHRREKTDDTEVVLFLDEADQDLTTLSSDAVFPDGFSPIAQLLRMGREYGILTCVGLGALGHVSKFVSASFQYTFIFNISEGEQIGHVKRTLVLPPGAEQMLPALKPGECIFRESQGAWAHPMWCKIDHMPPDRSTKDIQYDTHLYVPAMSFKNIPDLLTSLKKLNKIHNQSNLEKNRSGKKELSKIARDLLDYASLQPYTPVARLYDLIGIPTPGVQASVRKELKNNGLAEFEEIRIGKRNVLLIELTKKGWKSIDKEPPKRKGRGGIAHTHICQWLRMLGEKQGYLSKTEWPVPPHNSHSVDCSWIKGNKIEVFEVVVSCVKNLKNHLKACFIESDKINTVSIITPVKSTINTLSKDIEADPILIPFLSRINFMPAESLLKDLFS